jgi:hypothetical protein
MNRTIACLLSIALFSCSADTQPGNGDKPAPSQKLYNGSPLNHDNPYDASGQVFSTLFDAYYATGNPPSGSSAIVSLVGQLADEDSLFVSMKPVAYQDPDHQRIDYLLANATTCKSEVLAASNLTAWGKQAMDAFLDQVVAQCAESQDYGPVFEYITDFEDAVLRDGRFSPQDSEIILTTTSILRYSAYKARKKPKKNTDPDWDLLITHATATMEGADKGICEAVTLSLAAGVAGN